MLTLNQKKLIRSIHLFKYATKEKRDGKPINWDGTRFVVPSLKEIELLIYEEILKLGFSKVERTSPKYANCIIRVFHKLHYPCDHSSDWKCIYNIYGAACFTLVSGKWTSTGFDEKITEIDYSKWVIRHWICQDEYIDFDFDFFDCYVEIS